MIKNIIRVFTANGVVAIVGLLSSLFLPKALSIEEYATYQTFILYLSYIGVLHLGFPTGMSIKYAGVSYTEIDKKQYKSEIRLLTLLLLVFSCVFFCGAFIAKSDMTFYIALMIFPYCFLNSFLSLFQAWEKFKPYAVLHIICSAIPLLLPIIIYFIIHNISALLCIYLYIGIYIITTIFFILKHLKDTRRIRSNRVLSESNLYVEKLGFFFMLGNYINSLLTSIDKQFINWFGTTYQFSFYSFALTMQSVMTIFITAISQPLFPYMASGNITGERYREVKRDLLMLGSASGIAYFACRLVVRNWIPKYVESLSVIEIYFAVFPAMAVINCLYFNLYKTRKMMKQYIVDLLMVLGMAALADGGAVLSGHSYIGVCLVTTIVYYIWLFYGTRSFPELRFNRNELIFLALFLILFFTISNSENEIFGMVVYFVLDFAICKICFSKEVNSLSRRLIKDRR